MNWYKLAQITNYLQQLGYTPQFIQYISSLPKHIQKAVGNEINAHGKIPEPQFLSMIQHLLTQPQPANEIQNNKSKTPILDARFPDLQSKKEFFNKIPREYIAWVSNYLNNNKTSFIPNEDYPRLIQALNSFTELRKRNGLPIEKDINKYKDLLQIENVIEEYSGTGSKSGGYLQYNPKNLPGVDAFAPLKNGLTLYQISNVDSLEKMGIGTKWCTRQGSEYPSMAKNYISDYGYIFMIVKDNKPYIQMTPDLKQIMDVNDKETKLPKELYRMFNNEYSKKLRVQPEDLKLFEQEGAESNKELIFNTIKTSPRIIEIVSPELLMDPNFALNAIKRGSHYDYFSELMNDNKIGEDFTNAVERFKGEFYYSSLSYRDLDEDLEKIIFGKENFGVEPSLSYWNYEECYNSVLKVLDGRGGYNNNGGSQTYYTSKILAKAAVISDACKIKEGQFDKRIILDKAHFLAKTKKRYPTMNFRNDQHVLDLIEPFMVEAKNTVEERTSKSFSWDPIADRYTSKKLSPFDLEYQTKMVAFEMMQDQLKYPNLKSLKELDSASQKKLISEAIDSISNIASATKKQEDNMGSFYYEDDHLEYAEEPEIDNFASEEEYQEAYNQWQDEKDSARNEAESEYMRENLPFCLDNNITQNIRNQIEASSIKPPLWISRFFKEDANRPLFLSFFDYKKKKPRKSKKANGWYNLCKTSNSNIVIDSDLSDFRKKDEQDFIRIEAFDTNNKITVGFLNYFIKEDNIEIENIEVLHPYRRQGIGSLLVQKIKQDHPGLKIETGLVTNEGNMLFNDLRSKNMF